MGTRAALNSFEKGDSPLLLLLQNQNLIPSNPLTSLFTDCTVLAPILNTCVLESV